MLTIRALGHRHLEQVIALLDRYASQTYETLMRFRQLTIPFLQLSRALPARHQFLPAIYVACRQQRVLGVVVLSPDDANNRRWRIEQLIVDPEESSFDVGSQLLGYIMNRYGADGVHSFVAHVSQQDMDASALLKSAGFRYCTRQLWFDFTPSDKANSPQTSQPVTANAPNGEGINGGHQVFKEAGCHHAERLSQLYNDALPPDIRISLEKAPADYRQLTLRQCMRRIQGYFFQRWVLEDTHRDVVIAAIEISSSDFSHFYLNVVVSPVWTSVSDRLVSHGMYLVQRISRQARITTVIFDHDKALQQLLLQKGFEPSPPVDILVKEYWIPLSTQVPRLSSPVLLKHIAPA
jgi:ribosomal protein S18 acetylase RimI-like enzyme